VRPFVLVLSSPSGGGKTTIARSLLEGREELGYSVSATTRAMRPREKDGVDYHFVTRAEFDAMVAAGEFAEWAAYGGECYGTLKSELERIATEGRTAVLDIEIQGARQIRETVAGAVLVFVLPPSGAVLAERLRRRGTETPKVLEARMRRAAEEMAEAGEYDYVVVNNDLVSAVEAVAAIIDSEGRRVRRLPSLADDVARLKDEVLREAAALAAAAPT
jgi:guanylate kinase